MSNPTKSRLGSPNPWLLLWVIFTFVKMILLYRNWDLSPYNRVLQPAFTIVGPNKCKFRFKSGCWEHFGICVLPCSLPSGHFKRHGGTLCVLLYNFYMRPVCPLMEVSYDFSHYNTLCVLSLRFFYVCLSSFSKKSAMLRHQTDCPTFCLRLTWPSFFEKMDFPFSYVYFHGSTHRKTRSPFFKELRPCEP